MKPPVGDKKLGGAPVDSPAALVGAITAATPRIRSAVAHSHERLSVAERSDLMAAWAAADTAAKLAVLWRDRTTSNAVDPKLASAAGKLASDIDQMLQVPPGGDLTTPAVAVYNDARTLGGMFAVASPRHGAPALPAVSPDACKTHADSVITDLGGIATSELLLAGTRAGYPWVALTPSSIIGRADPALVVRPPGMHPIAPTAHDPATAEITRAFSSAPEQVAAFDAAVKKQTAAALAAPAGAPPDFAQVGALVDGLRTGSRARATAFGAGKPLGMTVARATTANDTALGNTKRELEACALAPDTGAARSTVITALTMIAAYGAPGASCTAGQNTCEPGTTCSGGQCVPWCGSCAPGDSCVEGRCTFPAIACQATSDCVLYPNTTCSGGECVQTCGASTCGRDQICTLSCVPRPVCGVCQVGQYCDGDTAQACANGPAERQCSNDADCKPPASVPSQANPRCVSVTSDNGSPINMCIGIGWACANANDCGPGTECDQSIGQCIDRETYTCNATSSCRNVEKCVLNTGGAQRCEPKTPAIGQPCDATGAGGALVYGECRKGTWQDAGHGAQKCVPGSPKQETCDGLDNDCDGVVDNKVPSHGCTAQATGACANGHSVCSGGTEQCVPSQPTHEVCDGQDNDCDGIADDIDPGQCHADNAKGDCANGTWTCSGNQQVCKPAQPNGEVCDGRDNDCNGLVDDLKTQHDAPVTDTVWGESGVFGISDNKLFGTADCGGDRESANATKIAGGNSHCEVVDWADIVCQDPNRTVGHSTVKDACNTFFGQGGQAGNNSHDCRYIVHFGTFGTDGITCQMSHVVRVPDKCQ